MTRTVTYEGKTYEVKLYSNEDEYIVVGPDRRIIYLDALRKFLGGLEYDPEPPTDGHYLDNEGDLWVFKNGEGKYWAIRKEWESVQDIRNLTFTKAEPEW